MRTGRLCHLETHNRSQTPHLMSYLMDMTWILQHQVYLLALAYPCHIHVISVVQKRYTWIYLIYPKQKDCIWYIQGISFHVMRHTYPCPFPVISLSGCLVQAANEIQPEIALWFEFCIPRHGVHHAQQDLFATAARADSSSTPGLGWGRRRRGLLRASGRRLRGGRLRGGRRR